MVSETWDDELELEIDDEAKLDDDDDDDDDEDGLWDEPVEADDDL
jgi:hypothetical protein